MAGQRGRSARDERGNTVTTTELHKCPKEGCAIELPREILACRPHWFALPMELRNRINRTWRGGAIGEYVAARQEAVDWLNR